MFYLLEQKIEEPNHFRQIGIVVAESIQDAVAKIKGTAIYVVVPPESCVACAELVGGYWLTHFEEVTSLKEIERSPSDSLRSDEEEMEEHERNRREHILEQKLTTDDGKEDLELIDWCDICGTECRCNDQEDE